MHLFLLYIQIMLSNPLIIICSPAYVGSGRQAGAGLLFFCGAALDI